MSVAFPPKISSLSSPKNSFQALTHPYFVIISRAIQLACFKSPYAPVESHPAPVLPLARPPRAITISSVVVISSGRKYPHRVCGQYTRSPSDGIMETRSTLFVVGHSDTNRMPSLVVCGEFSLSLITRLFFRTHNHFKVACSFIHGDFFSLSWRPAGLIHSAGSPDRLCKARSALQFLRIHVLASGFHGSALSVSLRGL